MYLTLAAGGITALCFSYFATVMFQRLSHRLGWLDHPGQHKAHAAPTPLLGGSAVFLGMLLPSLLAVSLARLLAGGGWPGWLPQDLLPDAVRLHLPGAASRSLQALGILAAAAVLHVVGLIDDRRALGPWMKLLFQLLAAGFVVVFCNVRVLTLAGPWPSVMVSILWLLVITNSFNFLDNMDGLATGVAAICGGALLAAALSMGQWFVAAWLFVMVGALLGFLPHNFPPARIFLGDAGSLVVGFLLGVASCLTTYVSPDGGHAYYGLLAPLLVMALPMYDTASVMFIRLREGRSLMVGDRRHFSHRLLRRGMSVRRVVLTIYLAAAGTAISAVLLAHTQGAVPAMLLAGQTVILLTMISLLESPPKL